MAAVQNQNLNDTYAQQFAAVMSGLLARADFPADQMSLDDFLALVAKIALAATRRISRTATDFSTVTPAVTVYDAGYTLSAKLFTPPTTEPPQPRFVPPKAVSTPSGNYVESE
jgi:hypothetical protein